MTDPNDSTRLDLSLLTRSLYQYVLESVVLGENTATSNARRALEKKFLKIFKYW